MLRTAVGIVATRGYALKVIQGSAIQMGGQVKEDLTCQSWWEICLLND